MMDRTTSSIRALLAGSLAAWAATLALSAGATRGAAAQKTSTNDAVYTKAQADTAKKQFDKICADCHPFTEAAKKKPKDVALGEEAFLTSWTGRPLSEMVTLIALTMPNDGSAAVSDDEAVGLVAYILQQNGYPAGSKPLTKATSAAVVEPPKPQKK